MACRSLKIRRHRRRGAPRPRPSAAQQAHRRRRVRRHSKRRRRRTERTDRPGRRRGGVRRTRPVPPQRRPARGGTGQVPPAMRGHRGAMTQCCRFAFIQRAPAAGRSVISKTCAIAWCAARRARPAPARHALSSACASCPHSTSARRCIARTLCQPGSSLSQAGNTRSCAHALPVRPAAEMVRAAGDRQREHVARASKPRPKRRSAFVVVGQARGPMAARCRRSCSLAAPPRRFPARRRAARGAHRGCRRQCSQAFSTCAIVNAGASANAPHRAAIGAAAPRERRRQRLFVVRQRRRRGAGQQQVRARR